MAFTLIKLPFDEGALEPFLSRETLAYHHGKHHAAYVNNLNNLIKDTKFESMDLVSIIKNSDGGIFNNSAQVFNHDFYWHCLSGKQTKPSKELENALKRDFGSIETFKEQFTQKALTLFGSGWVWLSIDNNSGKLEIEQTSNADTPLRHGRTPLLTCDVWEHAYYIDYRNARAGYLEKWQEWVNWDFVSGNYNKANILSQSGYSDACYEESELCDYIDTMQATEHVNT
jgi:Fe-Mn family superoxide dismutase